MCYPIVRLSAESRPTDALFRIEDCDRVPDRPALMPEPVNFGLGSLQSAGAARLGSSQSQPIVQEAAFAYAEGEALREGARGYGPRGGTAR